MRSFGSFQSVWNRLRPFFVLGPRFLRLTRTRPPSRETTTRFPVTRSSRPHAALCWAARGPRSVAIGGRAEGLDIQGDAVGAELRLRFGQRAEHGDRAACIRGQLRRAPVVDAQHHQGGVESRPPLRPTGVFLAVVRRGDRHRRAPGGANVDGLQAVAPHPPGQVAHEGARRVANRGGAHRALQHGGEEGAEELVRDGPQLLFALLRFLCRPGRWSTRLKLQRPPEGSAQVDGNVAKIDLAARGVDGALVHFNAPSCAVRAVMSSTTLPVCPKTGSTSPSLTVHLCLHTALLREIGNAPRGSSEAQRSADSTADASCVSRSHGGADGWQARQ